MNDSHDPTHRRQYRPGGGPNRPPRPRKKAPPAEVTHAEEYYYIKQIQNKTTVVLTLRDDEELVGRLEWYDRDCLKLNREDGPNLVVYKDFIKFIAKADEEVEPEVDEGADDPIEEDDEPVDDGG